VASLLRLFGDRRDEPAARLGYYVAFVMLLPCPVLLTLDLTQPLRFWHMLVNVTPDHEGLSFKYWSPMSIGAWALVVYGVFATLSFVHALLLDWRGRGGRATQPMRVGPLGKLYAVVGLLLGMFLAGYTGVLLSVSNQPVWSDTWALGGLFLASGLSAAVALIGWLVRFRKPAGFSASFLARGERWFQFLELALIVTFAVTLIPAGALDMAFGLPWLLLWAVVLACLIPGLGGFVVARPSRDGTAAAPSTLAVVGPWLVLIGVLALRAAVIFSAQ
jgi:formate-dependent nitrite reductase membrane component NrfD